MDLKKKKLHDVQCIGSCMTGWRGGLCVASYPEFTNQMTHFYIQNDVYELSVNMTC